MANGKGDGADARPRISAWLPPGLALGWLGVLATFVHRTERLLAVWAATGFVAFLIVLLIMQVRRHIRGASRAPRQAKSDLNRTAEGPAATAEVTRSASPRTAPLPPETEEGTASTSASEAANQPAHRTTAESPAALELRILTAAEAASVLRVDTGVIIKAISDGEFPGNRIGGHWRVDEGALTRWLQGKYRDPVGPPSSPSAARLKTDPS